MKRPILAAALAFLVTDPSSARAQFVGGPLLPASGRGGVVLSGNPYFGGLGCRPRGFVFGIGRPYFGPLLGVPVLPFPFTPLTIGGLLAPAFAPAPAPLVVAAPQVVINLGVGPPPEAMAPAQAPQAAADDVPRGAKPGDHVVIRPNKPVQQLPPLPPPEVAGAPPRPEPIAKPAARPEAVARAKPELAVPKFPRPEVAAPKAKAPALEGDPFAAKKPVNLERVDPDPVKESARLMKLGKDEFAAGEYGAAGEQFDRASAANRKNALPVFLKAQAAFAAGRYADAVATIRSGLEIDRTWPASPFDPKELYGANPAPFAEHVAALRTAVAANPGEPALEFLLGYELWFIGDKAEAKKWFDLAGKRLPDAGPLALFK